MAVVVRSAARLGHSPERAGVAAAWNAAAASAARSAPAAPWVAATAAKAGAAAAMTLHDPALDLRIVVADLAERLAAIEARLPPPRFTTPSGWIIAKQAAAVSGLSLPTIYRKVRTGEIFGVKVGKLVIDPATLPARK